MTASPHAVHDVERALVFTLFRMELPECQTHRVVVRLRFQRPLEEAALRGRILGRQALAVLLERGQ